MTTPTTRTPDVSASIDMTNINNPNLTLTFANGVSITISASDLTFAMAQMAMMHGLKQKLVDAAAISRNPDTGRTASVDDKFLAVREVYERVLAGQWNKTREAGTVSGGLLLRALCQLYPTKTVEQVREYLTGKTAEEKTALRKAPRIAAIIETLRDADSDSDEVDTDALLNELAD